MRTITQLNCSNLVTVGATLCLLLAAASPLRAEVTVTLSETHLCCPACYRAVDATLGEFDNVSHVADREEKTIAITAADQETAQKAIDALAGAGFHGKLDHEEVAFKPVEAPEGFVTRLEVSGVHNCCGACVSTLKKTVTGVTGVASDTVKARESSFVVQGEFDAAELVAALLGAGFYAQVK